MGGDLKALKLAFDMYAKSGSIFDTPSTGGTTGQTAFDLTAEDMKSSPSPSS